MYKILIVEDTRAIREEIYDILTLEGHTVLQAENGDVGYKMAMTILPDLILSDILMPELNGLEMFEKLKKNKKTKNIPLIFLSAKGGNEDIRSGMNAGAEDYLIKPINADELVEVVHRKLKKQQLIKKNIPVLIKKGLIEKIVSCSKIPTIKHLDGNCHVYIDETADANKAINISINSKTQRYGVCNAMETLLIHKNFSKKHIIKLLDEYDNKGVEIRGCKNLKKIRKNISLAKTSDWFEEYLSPIIAIKIVDNLDDAIKHIGKYGSLHTDAIVASDKDVIDKFKRLVNSSSIMIYTSTRFADGYEYGLGAEIGISTDKLHVRGPVGLEGLTNLKYIVSSQGKLRN